MLRMQKACLKGCERLKINVIQSGLSKNAMLIKYLFEGVFSKILSTFYQHSSQTYAWKTQSCAKMLKDGNL